jgi:hypothetical protein
MWKVWRWQGWSRRKGRIMVENIRGQQLHYNTGTGVLLDGDRSGGKGFHVIENGVGAAKAD